MTLPYDPLLLAILALVVVLALAVMWLASRLTAQSARIESQLAGSISSDIATRSAELQRALLNDLREGLASSAERVASRLTQLEASQAGKLEALKGELLAGTGGRINEQSRITQESTLGMLADIRLQFLSQAEAMQTAIEARLRDITGKVDVRLDEGFDDQGIIEHGHQLGPHGMTSPRTEGEIRRTLIVCVRNDAPTRVQVAGHPGMTGRRARNFLVGGSRRGSLNVTNLRIPP